MSLPRLFGRSPEKTEPRVTTMYSPREKQLNDTLERGLYPARVASRKGIRLVRLVVQVILIVLVLSVVLSYTGGIDFFRRLIQPIQGEFGGVVVSSEFVRAQVKLDGKVVGETPYSGQGISAGLHTITLEATDNTSNFFQPLTVSVVVYGDNTSVVRANPAPNQSAGSYEVITSQERLQSQNPKLIVKAIPQGAEIKVDGTSIGNTPQALDDLAAGPHQIAITKQGYKPVLIDVTIADTKTVTVDVFMYPYQVILEKE